MGFLVVLLLTAPVAPEQEEEIVAMLSRATKAVAFIDGGSGVVISPDGLVLTCNHVVPGRSREWPVYLAGGALYMGEVLGRQFESDLAVLKLKDARELPYLPLAPAGSARVGEVVLALGNPFMLGSDNFRFLPVPPEFRPSVSCGIISGVHRFGRVFGDALECDAPLNPGNSGGALINLRGEIVGIGGRIASRFGLKANTGAGYGASCDLIRRFLPALIRAGGKEIAVGDLSGVALRRSGAQILVDKLTSKGSPAASRLQPGDVLVSVGGMAVRSPESFFSALGGYPAGSTVGCWVRRAGKDILVPLELESKSVDVALLGVEVREQSDGLQVRRVTDPAESAGIESGDVIVSVGGIAIGSEDELMGSLFVIEPGTRVTVVVKRGDENKEISLELGTIKRNRQGKPFY